MDTARDDTRKELARFVLREVQQQRLPKDRAAAFLQLLQAPPAADGTAPARERQAGADAARRAPEQQPPIAIVGLACRFPKAADKHAFWQRLLAGRDAIRSFPAPRRADLAALHGERADLFDGGFFDHVDRFDAEYFRIPPAVALQIDPYQRLLLETFVETIEDAGYHRGALSGKPVGVFVGNDHTHRLFNCYLDFIAEPDFGAITGSWTSVLASRIAYLFNLKGPAAVFDTSCSSALVALDAAIKALRAGDCDSALVGAANLFFAPGRGIVGEIENDLPQVRAFDRDARGTVWGEGVAAVLLKPLDRALADGDTVQAIVRGIAVNNDGASNGLTAPNPKAQQDVILRAWQRAGVGGDDVSYVEAHGTGTQLGDPIEVKGLTAAFARHGSRRQHCAIGSVKTHIGHTVGVAGLASLVKVVLSLQHERLAPSLNFTQPNPHIDFCGGPLYVNDCERPWPRDGERPRVAGVSSFSLSGTNCHVVVEEAPRRAAAEEPARERLLPLAARTPALLLRSVQRLADWLTREPGAVLADACFTASVGREHPPVRAALGVCTTAELAAALAALGDALIAGRALPAGAVHCSLWVGGAGQSAAADARADAERRLRAALSPLDLPALASRYVGGATLPWADLYRGETRCRISLPAQPFASQRLWPAAPPVRAAAVAAPVDPDPAAADATAVTTTPATATTERDQVLAQVAHDATPVSGLPAGVDVWPYRVAAHAWSRALGYPTLDAGDDFYALGGDSLTGLKIVQWFNGVFGMALALSDLFGAPTFGRFVDGLLTRHAFAERLAGDAPPAADQAGAIERVADAPWYAASRAQQRMAVLERLSEGSTAYHVNAVVALDGEAPDAAATEALLRRLIARHEALRTGFETRDGQIVQVVHEHAPFAVETIAVDAGDDALAAAVRRFIRPFDLAVPPLLRVALLHGADGRHHLAIDAHHIVTDGSSMGVLVGEFIALQGGAALPPLPCRYRDVAAWQNRQFADGGLAAQAQFWQQRFAGEPPVLELPTDRPRPAVQDFRGGRVAQRLAPPLAAALRALARQHGTTLFVVLLAGFKLLLHRLGGNTDIVVGSPVAGRGRREFEPLVGLFVNTLALRDRVDPDAPFADWLATVRGNTQQALANADYPYEDLVDALNLPRCAGRNPLFDVCFALQNEDMGLAHGGVRVVPLHGDSAKFDLTVIARDTAAGIEVDWEYASALYDAATVERFAAVYERVLGAAAARPETPLHAFDLLGDAERRRLVERYNDTATDYPGAGGIAAQFERQVARDPAAVALRMQGHELRYGELNARADRLARRLRAGGLCHGDAVALLCERSFEMVVAILAVLKAGGAYVPLDAAAPAARQADVLDDCDAVRLLLGAGLHAPAGCGVPVLRLDDETLYADPLPAGDTLSAATLPPGDPAAAGPAAGSASAAGAAPSERAPEPAPSGEDLAYIMYTSGSTGRPKGTRVRQKSVIRVVCATDYLTIGPGDVCLLLSSVAFDGSVPDLFGALLNGATLLLPTREDAQDLGRLARVIEDGGVSSVFITTSLFNALVDAEPQCLRGVRQLMFGGEAASVAHVARAFAVTGPGRLINGYGPTETTVFATAHVVDAIDAAQLALPIGKPIANTRVYVLDERRQPVPVGVEGELYIGGDGVALGYLKRDELTAERFVADPFVAGERLYRSGDRVKWRADGTLAYLGRRDQQVKIRGWRIELGEIESALLRCDGVRECLVSADADAQGQRRLRAWVVGRDGDGGALDTAALRARLATTLPDYMVPPVIVALAAFPLNANGKIDRRALPLDSPADGADAADAPPATPRDDREATLAQVWAALLGRDSVGIHDNFFASGGDSIKAIQSVSRLQSLGYAMQVPQLFQHQTIAELAPHLSAAANDAAAAPQGPVVGELPLNPAQRWFLDGDPVAPDHFNHVMFIAVDDALPTRAEAAAALGALLAHHDALRSRFERCADGGWQASIVEPDDAAGDTGHAAFTLHEHEAATWAPDDVATAARIGELQAALSIERGPLVGVALLRTPDGVGGALVVAIHHLVVDVVSWDIVLEDLQACIAAAQRGIAAPRLPAKTASFAAWNAALRDAAGTALRSTDHWLRLADAPAARICPNGPAGREADARTAQLQLDAATTASLFDDAARVEPQALLLTALGAALSDWRGDADDAAHVVQLEAHGRDGWPGLPDVGRTVGWFTALFPFALPAAADLPGRLRATQAALRELPGKGRDHGVLAWLPTALDDAARARLRDTAPQIGFNFLGRQDATVHAVDRALTRAAGAPLALPLELTLALRGGRLDVEARFDSTRLAHADIDALLMHLERQLTALEQGAGRGGIELRAADFDVTPLADGELDDILADLAIAA